MIVSQNCGVGIGSCGEDLCCNKDGTCGSSISDCGFGCQSEFGICNVGYSIDSISSSANVIVKGIKEIYDDLYVFGSAELPFKIGSTDAKVLDDKDNEYSGNAMFVSKISKTPSLEEQWILFCYVQDVPDAQLSVMDIFGRDGELDIAYNRYDGDLKQIICRSTSDTTKFLPLNFNIGITKGFNPENGRAFDGETDSTDLKYVFERVYEVDNEYVVVYSFGGTNFDGRSYNNREGGLYSPGTRDTIIRYPLAPVYGHIFYNSYSWGSDDKGPSIVDPVHFFPSKKIICLETTSKSIEESGYQYMNIDIYKMVDDDDTKETLCFRYDENTKYPLYLAVEGSNVNTFSVDMNDDNELLYVSEVDGDILIGVIDDSKTMDDAYRLVGSLSSVKTSFDNVGYGSIGVGIFESDISFDTSCGHPTFEKVGIKDLLLWYYEDGCDILFSTIGNENVEYSNPYFIEDEYNEGYVYLAFNEKNGDEPKSLKIIHYNIFGKSDDVPPVDDSDGDGSGDDIVDDSDGDGSADGGIGDGAGDDTVDGTGDDTVDDTGDDSDGDGTGDDGIGDGSVDDTVDGSVDDTVDGSGDDTVDGSVDGSGDDTVDGSADETDGGIGDETGDGGVGDETGDDSEDESDDINPEQDNEDDNPSDSSQGLSKEAFKFSSILLLSLTIMFV